MTEPTKEERDQELCNALMAAGLARRACQLLGYTHKPYGFGEDVYLAVSVATVEFLRLIDHEDFNFGLIDQWLEFEGSVAE